MANDMRTVEEIRDRLESYCKISDAMSDQIFDLIDKNVEEFDQSRFVLISEISRKREKLDVKIQELKWVLSNNL